MNNVDKEREGAVKAVSGNIYSRKRAIFTKSELQHIVIKDLPDVGENERTIIKNLILEYLQKSEELKEVVFEFPSRKETRFTLGNISAFELAQSLKPNAYLAYGAAMFLNGLTDEFPGLIHINAEQSKSHQRNPSSLTQEAIDKAFSNNARVSNEIAEANGVKVCVTHGQKTNQLGVINKKGPAGELLRVTSAERTLIDIAVRPIYAGGPEEVLRAFRKSEELVSIAELSKILQEMNFVYPFHQVIGFYLEASKAFSKIELQPFERIDKTFDFYLDYRMENPAYSEKWRIYYPNTLVRE